MLLACWREAGSSSPGGSSYVPAAVDTEPAGGSVGAGIGGPPCTSPLWPDLISSVAAAWPASPAVSFSLWTGACWHVFSWLT